MNAETLKRISDNAAAAGLGLHAAALDSDEILELVAEVERLQTELAAYVQELHDVSLKGHHAVCERDEARAQRDIYNETISVVQRERDEARAETTHSAALLREARTDLETAKSVRDYEHARYVEARAELAAALEAAIATGGRRSDE